MPATALTTGQRFFHMHHLDAIRQPIGAELADFRQLFEHTLSHTDPFIEEALAHVRAQAGKMMRPMMVLLVAKDSGKVSSVAHQAAVALEMLHTASLVHDDVVDEADVRRGQASVNTAYGNKVAVLLGDYMLSRLLLLAAQTNDLRIVEQISRLGGTLSEGEIYQLQNLRQEIVDEQAYFKVIHHKTAELFATCAELGAIATGRDAAFCQSARRFGEIVGLCFQLRDDILDYRSNATVMGKPTAHDLAEGKLTLPIIHALSKAGTAQEMARVRRLRQGTATPEDLPALLSFVEAQGGIEYTETRMYELRSEALSQLSNFSDESVKKALQAYLDYAIEREK